MTAEEINHRAAMEGWNISRLMAELEHAKPAAAPRASSSHGRRLAEPLYTAEGRKFERRFFVAPPAPPRPAIEARAAVAQGSGVVRGEAIVYNSESRDLGGFREIVMPGAVTESLRKHPDVFCYAYHNREKILGRTLSGTLLLDDKADGLHFVLNVAPTSHGVEAYTLVARGDLTDMSFGFYTIQDKWYRGPDGIDVRELHEIELSEISLVDIGAYTSPYVTIGTRSAADVAQAEAFREAWFAKLAEEEELRDLMRERRIEKYLAEEEEREKARIERACKRLAKEMAEKREALDRAGRINIANASLR